MPVDAAFVRSAAALPDLPGDGLAELAMVGRSNVGKSSLINGLVGRSLARTSGAPGKTRLINLYRVRKGTGSPFYLVDLPGYGFARGRAEAARVFQALTDAYFESRRSPSGGRRAPAAAATLLLVDARHPGLPQDLAAYDWLAAIGGPSAVVATKIDKLTRAERTRVERALETAFNGPVLPVSAASGEGLKELWTLIERLLSSHPPRLAPRPSR